MRRTLTFALSLILLIGVCGCKESYDDVSSGVEIIYEYEDAQGNTVSTQSNSSEKNIGASSADNSTISSKNDSENTSYASKQSNTNNVYNTNNKYDITSAGDGKGKFKLETTDAAQSQEFWDNVLEYAIIYGEKDNYEVAQMLKEYFYSIGIALSVYKDSDYPSSEKEILVGDTTRFSTDASDSSYVVQLTDGILRFEGDNVTAVEMAATKFIENCALNEPLPKIEGELSGYQVPRVINGKNYNYVWGDEFEDSSVDFLNSKTWNITHMMGYYSDFEIVPPEDVDEFTYAKDGKLVLTAGEYDFSDYIGTQNHMGVTITDKMKYGNGGVLTTSERMVYRRGYAEIYASVPTNNGSWPAWWTRSTSSKIIKYEDGTTSWNPVFTLEVDIFECYDSLGDKIIPNLHKWYKNTVDRTTWEVYGYNGEVVTSKSEMASFIGGNEEKQFSTCVAKLDTHKTYQVDSTEEWHKYGFLWTEDAMTFLVDDVAYYTIDLTTAFDGYSDGRYDYNQYMYFLFDNHIYTPCAGKSVTYSSSLPDPVFEVEYIRLYQLTGERDIILNPDI